MENEIKIAAETVKSIAGCVGQTTNAIAKIKEIKRTTGITKHQSKKLKLESQTDLEIAEAFKTWCEQNPGYIYKAKIGNLELSNVSKILDFASNEFNSKDNIPKEELDKEWLLKFLDVSGQITDIEKQKILAKVLCGELKRPESISYRTLRVLKDLNKKDIILFKKAISCCLHAGRYVFIPRSDENLLSHGELFQLSQCGLVDESITKVLQVN